jgi:Zn ribbon nucleic-acid-binding protein
MSQIQSSPAVCPKCKRTMKLMLAKGGNQRVLRCVDCGQPDPMCTTETNGWLNGELRERK